MIDNLDEAVSFFRREVLENRGKITKVFNGARGQIAKRITVTDNDRYVVFYKKSWHPYFGRQFRMPQHPIGQTTNLRILEEAAVYGETIGIVHPNTEAYTCLAQDWLTYARQNGTIWIPKTETQQEASIPAFMLSPVSRAAEITLERIAVEGLLGLGTHTGRSADKSSSSSSLDGFM